MICKKCNKFEVAYRNECKVCGFKKRRKEDIDNVLKNGFWSLEEIETIIYSILYAKYDCINKILPNLNNKTLDNLVFLLTKEMTILGVATSKVGINCDVCNDFYLINLSQYNRTKDSNNKKYCSFECRNKGFNIFGSHAGENNSGYNSKMISCTNCGTNFLAPKYKQIQTNSYGENNHYCSQECYWDYRGKHYIKEKNGNYGKIFSEDIRREMSIRSVKQLCSGNMPQTKTKPHVRINKLLEDITIKYTNEYNCKYHALDIFLDDYDLGIEIMGDYWHGSPIKYKKEDLSLMHKKDIKQDKSKHTYVKKYHNFEILYLWETDINKNIEVCELLIKEYINKNGILQDYNSFNYSVNGNELLLKSELVKPYFIN